MKKLTIKERWTNYWEKSGSKMHLSVKEFEFISKLDQI